MTNVILRLVSFLPKRGERTEACLALAGHPRHLGVPPKGLIKSSVDRAFRVQTPRCAFGPPRLFHLRIGRVLQ
jgi:hypothetical protein